VRLTTDLRALAAFAVRVPEGGLRVCLINKDFARGARVRIDAGRSFGGASVTRLAGPVADATSGITLGGASVDDFGRWVPGTGEAAPAAGGEIAVHVPAMSAALVSPAG
jgi:Glycosyl hydrolase family 79 C-terminal beta domain